MKDNRQLSKEKLADIKEIFLIQRDLLILWKTVSKSLMILNEIGAKDLLHLSQAEAIVIRKKLSSILKNNS